MGDPREVEEGGDREVAGPQTETRPTGRASGEEAKWGGGEEISGT